MVVGGFHHVLASGRTCIAETDDASAGAAILQQLRGFQQLGSVLHVAAHPDDENTQLITYLARGRHVRTAYLSVTRGDGGQNVLGPEFGDELGLIRTQELLAARRLDGGQQFFTRAIDFGFSKDYRETLRIWDEQAVLSDVVRVIRTFQPDVIVTRFSPEASRTHGHHTASAVLAVEAFKLAGDPKAFPEQLERSVALATETHFDEWRRFRPRRTCGGRFRRSAIGCERQDPVLHESFAEIAGQEPGDAQIARLRKLRRRRSRRCRLRIVHATGRRTGEERYFRRRRYHLESDSRRRGNRHADGRHHREIQARRSCRESARAVETAKAIGGAR